MSETWTIGELAEHAGRLLRDGAPPPANGRVRDVPGERLIRWYTTIGLVDPPLTRRGRIARYGRRHLLQLVAVKRLQATGRSIAEIQAMLAGATDRMLETAARVEGTPVPDAGQAGGAAGGRAGGGGPGSRAGSFDGETARGRFWAERPGAETARAHGAAPDNVPPKPGAGRAEDAGVAPGHPAAGNGNTSGPGPAAGRPQGTPAGAQPAADHARNAPAAPESPAGHPRSATAGAPPAAGHGRGATALPGRPAGPGGASDESAGAGPRGAHAVRGRPADAGLGPGVAPARAGGDDTGGAGGPTHSGEAGRGTAASAKSGAGHGGVASRASVVSGVRLGDGVRLVLDAGRVPSEEDVQAVLAAAGPLLAVLEERELT
ncbi:MerR family transcriptional regulator [Nonomuraea sp. KM90]|uniref:MerR family transcriptional regulator n=1 Tax=Nonomuraea sp. KM90 TaxID=3457428 RepID=UPI003FCDD7A2